MTASPEVLAELLARVVAAREELEAGALDQAAQILADLEPDVATLLEEAA
jgi:hypothetical protein